MFAALTMSFKDMLSFVCCEYCLNILICMYPEYDLQTIFIIVVCDTDSTLTLAAWDRL